MTQPRAQPSTSLDEWSDEQLVKACLGGREEAWSALIRRYARLIYSIPIRNGFSQDHAADIFQQVCLKLLESLPTLRQPETIAAWLITVATHLSIRALEKSRRLEFGDVEKEYAQFPDSENNADELVRAIEREKMVHEAMSELKPRCRELIRMLFFDMPPAPYEQVANHIGVAKGSIGFLRMRCLSNLRRYLEERGF